MPLHTMIRSGAPSVDPDEGTNPYRTRLRAREVLCLGGRFGFGGMGADVGYPAADEREEPVEAVGGQLAEQDFRTQAGQVRLAVEPPDAQAMQACS